MRTGRAFAAAAVVLLAASGTAWASPGATGAGATDPTAVAPGSSGVSDPAPPPAPAPAEPAYDEDLDLDVAEPDYEVVDLPTSLRVPRGKLAFRLTHRFARPLGQGRFEDLLADFFGFDGGAQIGFGLRFGLLRGTQVRVYRTSDRTIQVAAQHELLGDGPRPVALSLALSIEGQNNFGLSASAGPVPVHEFSPSVALVLSNKLGDRGAVYAVPSFVFGTRVNPSAPGTADDTLVLGLGLRIRVAGTMAVVAEYHPRLAGYRGDLGSGDRESLATLGVEWRVGGHAFQINFSNDLGTTPAQIARGQQGTDDWFIGFNLSRKFY